MNATIVAHIKATGITVRGKILANLAINANSPNFFPANAYKDTETTEDLPLDPPKFSSPYIYVCVYVTLCVGGSKALQGNTSYIALL